MLATGTGGPGFKTARAQEFSFTSPPLFRAGEVKVVRKRTAAHPKISHWCSDAIHVKQVDYLIFVMKSSL